MAIFGVSLSTSKRTGKELGLVLRGELVETWLCFDFSDRVLEPQREAAQWLGDRLNGPSTGQCRWSRLPPGAAK